MRLDDFLPVYQFHEVHAVRIEAPPERIAAAIKEVTPRELGIVPGMVMWIRSIPSLLKGESGDGSRLSKPLLQPPQDSSWLVLAEERDQELVIGFVGRFWEADGGPHIGDGNGCRVSTETRILTTDAVSQGKFGRYWQVIYPGTALIRKGLLRAIKRRAEENADSSPARSGAGRQGQTKARNDNASVVFLTQAGLRLRGQELGGGAGVDGGAALHLVE
jgi:hypothetical protein